MRRGNLPFGRTKVRFEEVDKTCTGLHLLIGQKLKSMRAERCSLGAFKYQIKGRECKNLYSSYLSGPITVFALMLQKIKQVGERDKIVNCDQKSNIN
jgi:hypothetical protein